MESRYIGVDLHSATFQACAVAADGARQWEDRFPRTDEGVRAFCGRCPTSAAVAIEATTPTWHFVDAIAPQVGRVIVVDPLRTRLKAGYAAKTDRLDALRLADALRRDSVVGIYYPSLAVRELRELCRCRHALVRTRTRLIQRIRALLLRHGIAEARQRLTRARGLAWLETLALPPDARASLDHLRRVLGVVQEENHAVDQRVTTAAAADPIVARLVTIAGIGPSSVSRFAPRSATSDASRPRNSSPATPASCRGSRRVRGMCARAASPKPGHPGCGGRSSKPRCMACAASTSRRAGRANSRCAKA